LGQHAGEILLWIKPMSLGTGDEGIKQCGGLTIGRYYFESTYAPNVIWIDITKLDFSKGQPEMELKVEKEIFKLNGNVTDKLEKAKPFVFGMNKR
jgi:hypothetical protein